MSCSSASLLQITNVGGKSVKTKGNTVYMTHSDTLALHIQKKMQFGVCEETLDLVRQIHMYICIFISAAKAAFAMKGSKHLLT